LTTFALKIQQIANQAGLKVMVVNDNFVGCSFGLGEGRSQTVHLGPAGDLAGQEVVRISTPVKELPADLPADLANQLLKMNTQFKIGSFGIMDSGGKKLLMFTHNMLLDALEPKEFATVVATLATSGDDFEKKFGGQDKF
jgi:hypothetical protein